MQTASLQCFSITPVKIDSLSQHLLRGERISLAQGCRVEIHRSEVLNWLSGLNGVKRHQNLTTYSNTLHQFLNSTFSFLCRRDMYTHRLTMHKRTALKTVPASHSSMDGAKETDGNSKKENECDGQ